MFKEILRYMQKYGEFDTKIIAKNLRLNEVIVKQVKDELIKKGYIIKGESLCDIEKCKNCSCDCSGKLLNEFNIFKFSDKAMKIINK
ncbi:MAG: FeoC-like transcriptional regulator [Sarcina sp.]